MPPPTNTRFLVPLIITLLTIVAIIYNWSKLFTPTDLTTASKNFQVSQYVLGDARQVEISDEEVYIYAADQYFRGVSPTQINFEHPPAGKYLLGLSLKLFNNVLWINVFAYLLTLISIAVIAKNFSWRPLATCLALLLFGANPFVLSHVGVALLDTLYMACLTAFIATLFWPRQTNEKFLFLGVLLGLFMGVKYYFPLIFLPSAILIYYVLHQRVHWHKPLCALALAGCVYLLGYTTFFVQGHNLIDWLNFEKYSFGWRMGDRSMPRGLIWQTLFLGKHTAWWQGAGVYKIEPAWNFTLPIYFLSAIVSLVILLRKNCLSWTVWIFGSVILLPLLAYTIGSGSELRLLLLIFPFLCLIIGMAAANFKKP